MTKNTKNIPPRRCTSITEVEIAVVLSAARWASNILVEVTGNYAHKLPPRAGEALRNACSTLQSLQDEMRFPTLDE
jgi:hypothetical protein